MKSMIHSCPARRTFRPRQRGLKTLFSILLGAVCAGGLSAQAAPVTHGIAAANVTVIQNDTGNNATSVTLVPTLSINDFRVTVAGTSRADYGVQIGPVATNNVRNGILISSITDNGRNNGETGSTSGTRYGTPGVDSNASTSPGSSGIWWVPVFGSSATTNIVSGTNSISYSYVEENFDFAAAWFPYTKYYGGWLANSGGTNGGINDQFIGNTNLTFGPVGANIQQEVAGSTTIGLTNLTLDSRSNAVMICCGGKNEENYAVAKINWADGTWLVSCRDDQSGSAEQDYIAWVVVPLNNTNGLIAGTFAASLNPATGVNAVNVLGNAPYTAVHTGTGTYHLTIPGALPSNGVLIITGAQGDGNNSDNIVSYQVNGNGWDIQTRDTGSANVTASLQNFSAVSQSNPAGGMSDVVASFVYIPAPTAVINVTPANGLVTTQSGGTATFSVTLGSVPATNVTLALQVSDATAASLSTNVLIFQNTNYNVPQSITVTGLNNSVSTAENYTVNITQVSSLDTNYNGLTAPSVALVNIPANTPGIFLIPSTGLITAPGSAATFQAIMNQPPTDTVTVNFTSSDTLHGGTISPSSVTFSPANWSTQQVVAVTGVDDGILDGNIAYQITASAAVSSDPNYNGYNAGSVSVVNQENDVAGVNVSCGTSISVPEGSSTSFTVVLTAQPVSNVTIAYTSGDTTAGTVSPATLTFTPANWNVPQTVAVTGVANPALSGNANFILSAVISSSNYGYSTLILPNIAGTTVKPIGLPSGTTAYGLGMPPVGIDGQATASFAINFSGATLAFSITANADATDVLGIRNDPTGAGITVSGNTVSYSNNPVATFSGGAGSVLNIAVNNNVTSGAVAALLQAVTFSTATTNDFANRTVQLSLNNGGSVVNKTIRVGQLRITQYQDGVDWGYGAYNSQTNDEIASGSAGTAWSSGSSIVNGLLVQGGSTAALTLHQVLLGFFDLVGTNAGQIPPGSTIVSADLTVNIQKAGHGWAFHRMLSEWDDTYSWSDYPYNVGVDDIDDGINEAELNYYSQMGNFITISNSDGTMSATTAGIKIGLANVGVTPDVQAWVNGTNNFGWVCDASEPWGYDDLTTGTGFTPSQSTTSTLRPHLRVYWLPPTVAGAGFQNGTNGYASGHDTDITQSTPTITNSALTVIWSDGADPGLTDLTEALFRFDDIIGTGTNQIPPGAHIEAAMLNLACLSSTDCNGNGGQFFPLYQSWNETNLTWNSWNANGQGILNDGVQAAIAPTATAGTYTLETDDYIPGGYHSFEVTADVQNWANGAANNGWGVIPWYISSTGAWGADGWGMNSSKDPNVSSHPQLVVYYTVNPGFVARPTLMPLVVSATQVSVKFGGTVGATYTVWRSDSVNGTWINVGTAIVGQDGTATFNDAAPLSTAAFYRVSNP